MKAVFIKEWKAYFKSPIGYIFSGIFLALCAIFFVSGTLAYQTADLKSMFANINVIYLFLVSILTMGLLSLERSRRTDQLLLTAPVSVTQIVIGKYLAALSVFGITLAVSLIFPMILCVFGSPSITEMIGSYIGFILLWGAFISIGLFISALTESQMIAAIVTFGVLLLVFYMDWIAANISNAAIQKIVTWFSLMSRYEEFQNGILNTINIVYYLSFIGVFLFLTVQAVRRRQYGDTRFKIHSAAMTAAVLAGAVLLNGIVTTLDGKLPIKFDMTQDKVYEFSAQTKEVMNELSEPIDVYALYSDSMSGELVSAIKEYLSQYQSMNSLLKVTYIDPYEDPAFARKYGDDAGVGTVVVQKGERFKTIPLSQLYRQSQSGTVSIDMEKQMTAAIRYVAGNGAAVKAYLTEGHGEYRSQELKKALESEGYTVETINLASSEIPEDASILISMAPSADVTAEERDVIDAYLLKGGRAAWVFTAGTSAMERLYGYLSEWGITPNSDFAYEGDSSKAMRSNMGVPVPSPTLQKHTITEKLQQSDIPFAAPVSCSFTLNENNLQHTYVTSLLETSKNSWGITDLQRSNTQKAEGDISGPLSLSAISEKSDGTGGSVLVLGSLQAVETDGILEESSYCNGDFVLNAFSYMTQKGDSLNIRAKIISAERLTMTEMQVKVISIVLQYVLPILILAAGLLVWLRRRYL